MKKKSSHSVVIYTPGHWTGNNISFKGGLRAADLQTSQGQLPKYNELCRENK